MGITTEKVVSNYLHIGSLTKESNPKTRKYWLTSDNGLTVLNPDLVAKQLDAAKEKVQAAKKDGKEVLIVCEKSMYANELAEIANKAGVHYLNYKLPAGFLTNFNTLIKRIDSMNEKKSFVQSESYERLTKKEKVMIKRDLAKVEKIYE